MKHRMTREGTRSLVDQIVPLVTPDVMAGAFILDAEEAMDAESSHLIIDRKYTTDGNIKSIKLEPKWFSTTANSA